MKNPSIEEIAKIEKCECEQVCEACKEKYSHTFTEGLPVTSNITGDLIAKFVLSHQDEQHSELAKDIAKIKEILKNIENREINNNK